MKNEQELVFFDLETTGLDHSTDQIIEIGAVKVRGGKEVGRFEQFCRLNEGAHLSSFISALTGITALDLEPAGSVDQVVHDFMRFAGTSPLLAHNSTFDEAFLRKALHGQLQNEVFDTLQLARIFFPDLQSHSLLALIDSLAIKKEEAHRALGDSLSLFRFYRKLKDKIAQSQFPDAVVRRIAFLYPAVVRLGLVDTIEQTDTMSGVPGLESVLFPLDSSRLPHPKVLRKNLATCAQPAEASPLEQEGNILVQYDAASLQQRYLSAIEKNQAPAAVLLRSPAALDTLLVDAPPDTAAPTWIAQESPDNLICLALLDQATRSPTMQREFGFELAALTIYEWETRSVFIPAMPLFLKRSALMYEVAGTYCEGGSTCPFAAVCPRPQLLELARSARIHVTDLSEAPRVLTELAGTPDLLVTSPETEKLMTDVLEVPETEVPSSVLRIIAGMAGELGQSPALLSVASSAGQAAQLLQQLQAVLGRQEGEIARGRVTVSESLLSASQFTDLRMAAETLAGSIVQARNDLPPTIYATWLAQSRELAAILATVDDPSYAVWMERQGKDTAIARARTLLAPRLRAYSPDARFYLAGTSVFPADDRTFLPQLFGLDGPSVTCLDETRPAHRAKRTAAFVPLYLPKPSESGFEKESAHLVAETMQRFPGKAMVASNSLETLRRMQSFLARDPGLAEYGLLLPKNGHTREQLLADFASQDKCILLVPFDFLSFGDIVAAPFLFVTKLQFPNSFLPTVSRLKQYLKEQRADVFRRMDLPYALTLLQYTLRQMDDQVLKSVFLLDSRSFSAAYADRIRAVLPTPGLFLPMETQESLLEHLDRWTRKETL